MLSDGGGGAGAGVGFGTSKEDCKSPIIRDILPGGPTLRGGRFSKTRDLPLFGGNTPSELTSSSSSAKSVSVSSILSFVSPSSGSPSAASCSSSEEASELARTLARMSSAEARDILLTRREAISSDTGRAKRGVLGAGVGSSFSCCSAFDGGC